MNPAGVAPVVTYLNQLLSQAVRLRASDIHVEPQAQGLRVRWRIDGHLNPAPAPPPDLGGTLVSRIKVLAKLDIAEKRLPQDGHIKASANLTDRPVEFRVSSLPTIHGEKVVLRILDHDASNLQLAQLGLDEVQLRRLQLALQQPQGMILVTGPTGSGKTVTLYSCMQHLNRHELNLSAVEDPCEIQLPGVTQVNVNEKAGLNFANVMRALLRQDPDIIMIGEVRDSETADMAIKAAQTGHLVLSTLHTNDAPASLSRLIHMGVPAYQVASSVSLICAQRLVRRLCENCKQPDLSQASRQATWAMAEPPRHHTLYRPVGCPQCVAGYRGRIGVFQVLPIQTDIADAMLQGAPPQTIAALAQGAQIPSLRQAALQKARQGVTSLAEVFSQTADD